MSWFQKNYEKAALGGAVAIALGLAYMGWSKFGSVEADFPTDLKGAGNNNAAVRDADLIPKALASLKLDRTWERALVGDRPVDLFVGIPLFVPSSAPESTIDLQGKDSSLVHPPIPNIWWLDNRLDPGFGDSPARDPDQDGFTNLEEYNGKTDPNNIRSYPPLIAKLMYVRDESLGWVVRPSFGDNGKFPFKYEDTKGGINQTGAADMIEPNGMFFPKGVMANRFKLLGSEVRKEVNRATNVEKDVTIVRIEDQRPNKKGTIYEFPSPLSDDRKREHLKWDRTAILTLEALGQQGKEFKVEENMTFALPSDGAKKEYLLKSVTPDSITVEYTDAAGEKKSVTVSKGSLPKMAD
ncbi:MAG: Amuc_1099 family pilus-like system protein [Verrucomicrobiota bacterium]